MTAKEFLSQHRRVFVVASSRYAADDLVRASCDTALLGVERYTLRELVYSLSSERMNALSLSPISGTAHDVLAAQVARRAKLGVLRESAGFPGFPRALARTLRDLRLERVSPRRLREAGRTGRDLAILLDEYEAELENRGFADYASRLEFALDEARTMEAAALVLIAVQARTAIEKEFLGVLVQRASATLLIPAVPGSTGPENCLRAVQRYALSGEPAPPRPADDSFRFVSASTESLECVEIARQILHGGTAYDDTAILLRNPQRHGPLIREAVDRAGIPAWYSQGSQKADLAGRAFLLLLRCRVERFSAKRFAEYLSLGQAPVPINVRWERLLRRAAVISGVERWRTRLTVAGASAADVEALDSLREFALPLIELLVSLPDSGTLREWLAKLDELAELGLSNPRSVRDLIDELAPLGDMGPVRFSEVMHLLERSLAEFRAPETGTRYGRVFVAPIEEAQGMRFRTVFVPGLNEGMFPRTVREDPLLLDEQRIMLGMPTSEDDAELMWTAAACATERIVFSCARVDLATGRARVPSFFAAEVLNAAYGSGVDVTKLLEDAKSSSETRIGWSAPSLPLDSIDDAEYDLAAFRVAATARAPGSYSWIHDLNKHTKRAIEARQRRWSKEWSFADGLANTDVHVSAILSKARLKERAYTVSALQQFARCPYKFYLSEIAGLSPMEDPDALERMDALVRGRLYHKVLFQLFQGGQEDRLDEIVKLLADELAEEHAPPVRGVWDAEVEKLRVDLHGWLAVRGAEWTPAHVELSFGVSNLTEHDAASSVDGVTVAGGYRLIGSIDLVERNAAGDLRVTDHKTGRFPYNLKGCVIGGGEVLQPVLYALAVQELLTHLPGYSQLSYATLRGEYKTIPIRIDAEAQRRAARVLTVIDEWIDQAFLPAAPKADGCKGCEYMPVCGPYEEQRVKEKSQTELRSLTEIRRLK